ncbi:hypothetical protein MPC1_7490002 [Methylocella tundrae]|nr:hypothetical protein MPC1_7490002 [Methylocella tundrae]
MGNEPDANQRLDAQVPTVDALAGAAKRRSCPIESGLFQGIIVKR